MASGTGAPGSAGAARRRTPGASVNDITDPALVDRLTGNAAFNAVPVRLEAVAGAALDAGVCRRRAGLSAGLRVAPS